MRMYFKRDCLYIIGEIIVIGVTTRDVPCPVCSQYSDQIDVVQISEYECKLHEKIHYGRKGKPKHGVPVAPTKLKGYKCQNGHFWSIRADVATEEAEEETGLS
jgi:hypothetical protein